jgi:hypothetical protein
MPSGLQLFLDHDTESERQQRPERSLRDLVGVLAENAYWDDYGEQGPGLYARIRVFDSFAEQLRELAPHIGLSVRALGESHFGEAEGESGPVIERIHATLSVDFVTLPGRGGKV